MFIAIISRTYNWETKAQQEQSLNQVEQAILGFVKEVSEIVY